MEDNILNKKININFIDGPFVEIIEDTTLHYKIEFIDRDDNKIIFELDFVISKILLANSKTENSLGFPRLIGKSMIFSLNKTFKIPSIKSETKQNDLV